MLVCDDDDYDRNYGNTKDEDQNDGDKDGAIRNVDSIRS